MGVYEFLQRILCFIAFRVFFVLMIFRLSLHEAVIIVFVVCMTEFLFDGFGIFGVFARRFRLVT